MTSKENGPSVERKLRSQLEYALTCLREEWKQDQEALAELDARIAALAGLLDTWDAGGQLLTALVNTGAITLAQRGPKPRAVCAICGRSVTLTITGRFHTHNTGEHDARGYLTNQCVNSGRLEKIADTADQAEAS